MLEENESYQRLVHGDLETTSDLFSSWNSMIYYWLSLDTICLKLKFFFIFMLVCFTDTYFLRICTI